MSKLIRKHWAISFMQLISALLLFSLSSYTFAAKNPISWTESGTFPSTVLLNTKYIVTYTLTNQLPFQLVHPLNIIKSGLPSSEYTFTDNCTGLKLTPQQSCTVSVALEATTEGDKQMQVTIAGYSNDKVPLTKWVSSTPSAHKGGGGGGGSSSSTIFATTVTALPSTLKVGVSAPFKFIFTNSGTQQATGVQVISSSQSFTSTCNDTHVLNAGANCTASGTFTPTSTTPSTQAVTATLTYTQGQGKQIVGASSTTVTNPTGITGKVTRSLPALAVPSTNYSFTFTFTNNDASSYKITTRSFPANGGSLSGCASTTTACPAVNDIFPGNSSCSITCTFNTASTGTQTYSATLTATGNPTPNPSPDSSTVTTSTEVVSSAGARTLTFTNNCGFPVWFSLNGGSVTKNQLCSTDADCNSIVKGSVCGPSNYCWWYNYPSSDGVYQLNNGASNTVIIPAPPVPFVPAVNAPGQQWSGNVSASLGCTGAGCLAAGCNNDNGNSTCAVGGGFLQPATQAEFTLQTNATDSYDVETINGFHIPIEMGPTGGQGVTVSGYTCGSPGAPTAVNGFGACNWSAPSPPSPQSSYYWVTSTGVPCNSCAAPNLCGYDSGFNQVCGAFLGYWTPNQLCSENASVPGLNCNLSLGAPFAANTYNLTQLYGCAVPDATKSTLNSCYGNYPPGSSTPTNSDCCGCADWKALGLIVPNANTTCPQTDPLWTQYVQGTISWMKNICPNYYVYSYDDATSSFTCSKGTPNAANYTITFCPGGSGNTGLPAGYTDGRA